MSKELTLSIWPPDEHKTLVPLRIGKGHIVRFAGAPCVAGQVIRVRERDRTGNLRQDLRVHPVVVDAGEPWVDRSTSHWVNADCVVIDWAARAAKAAEP